jgi:hypothetical protein
MARRVPGADQRHLRGPSSLTATWSTVHFSAPAELVQSGVNWLEIDWLDLPAGEEEIELIALEHLLR